MEAQASGRKLSNNAAAAKVGASHCDSLQGFGVRPNGEVRFNGEYWSRVIQRWTRANQIKGLRFEFSTVCAHLKSQRPVRCPIIDRAINSQHLPLSWHDHFASP